MSSIAWLETVGAGDLALVGGKAANLGELIRAGFDVPRGFVATTEAYHRRNPDGSVPAVVADEIRVAWGQLVADTGAAVAVRSSATAEDLAEASFAGQQETFLGVRGEDAVVAAVADCWASLFSERAVAYRRRHEVDETALGIAVVVQLMVDARAAGVMFTANPVNGQRRQVLVTAAAGLGEAVVAGTVNPDTFVVDRDAWRVLSATTGEPAAGGGGPSTLTQEQAIALARLGEEIEAHFAGPQDIEWALDATGFRVLQARPITALPDPVAEVADEWPSEPGNMYFRASIIEQLPNPLTPLFADLMAEAVPTSLQALMDELSVTIAASNRLGGLDIGFPTINGYAFYRYANSALSRVTAVAMPAMAKLFGNGGAFFLQRWRGEGLPAYRGVVRRWSERDPAQVATPELLAGVTELLAAGCRYYTHVQTVMPLCGAAEISWQALHATLVGVPRKPAEVYLLGLDSMPLQAEKELWKLGQWVLTDAGLTAVLDDQVTDPRGEAPPELAPSVWREWRQRFDAYLAEFGHTVYDLDFINPVPADDPAPILQALRFVLRGDAVDPFARQARLARERERAAAELLGALDPLRRRVAGATLRWAQSVVPAREDALAAIGLAWPLMRRLLAELGSRLTAEGLVATPQDVFWLTRGEAEQLAVGEFVVGLPDRIAERQARHRGQSLLRPPQYLPVSGMMGIFDRFLPARMEGAGGSVLKGNAGSGGVVTGPARVIGGPSDFGDFVPGEILVADITTPAYTPLFAVAGGVVTNIGGVLSHGSIVAREYGIPAVLGTGSATHRIRTGDTITVDGGRGEVRLDGAEPDESGRKWLPWVAGGAVVTAGAVWWLRRRRR